MRLLVMIAALGAGALATPGATKETQLSGMALQQIQAKDFEAPIGIVFPAVMTVLQDAGFRIQSAERDTGLITAIGPSKPYLTWLPFIGFGEGKNVPIVSAFIESRGTNYTRARLSFVMSSAKSQLAFSNETPVTNPDVYRDAFEKIEKEIFVRQATDAPIPKASGPSEGPAKSATIAIPAPMTPPAKHAVPGSGGSARWRQAAFSPGISVDFVDAANISREAETVRFPTMLYYRLDQGTDHYLAMREADCRDRSFHDITVTYYLGKTITQTLDKPGVIDHAAPETVNDRIITAACSPQQLGKIIEDPDTAAQQFFGAIPTDAPPTRETSPLWRQASYAPGISVAFVDADSVRREGQTVRFGARLYYRLDQGSDHYTALREASCTDFSFRDLEITYYLGQAIVGAARTSGPLGHASQGTVNNEVILAACNPRRLGKPSTDPDTTARLFFGSTQR